MIRAEKLPRLWPTKAEDATPKPSPKENEMEQLDLFTDYAALEKEREL